MAQVTRVKGVGGCTLDNAGNGHDNGSFHPSGRGCGVLIREQVPLDEVRVPDRWLPVACSQVQGISRPLQASESTALTCTNPHTHI